MELTQSYIKSILNYDPDTGIFTWLPRPCEFFANIGTYKTWNKRFSGVVAGFKRFDDYIMIAVNHKQYRAHRLAFIYMTGSAPLFDTDHINGIRDDNRWGNLRDVPRLENSKNMRLRGTNTSGTCGIHRHQGKWRARICVNGKTINIGCYDNYLVAVGKRKEAENRLGFHQNHGRAARLDAEKKYHEPLLLPCISNEAIGITV